MIPTSTDSDSLLLLISKKGLSQKLMQQIKKDFELSGLTFSIEKNLTSEQFLLYLYNQIQHLVKNNFEAYLQLLYRVDVPESSMQSGEIQNTIDFSKKATFLILKREWEKVYYREFFS
ncbi:MAG TPA: hypothetical protein EYG92_03015 [Lutibacter sp.]|nr:hypothetical protein [Lutibacter sp.]